MQKFLLPLFSFIMLASMVLVPNVVLAQTGSPKTVESGLSSVKDAFPQTTIDASSPQGTLKSIINWALYLAGILAVLFVIYGGYQYLTAGGNDAQATAGRKTLTNALIGLAITILAYVIVQIVYNFLTK